MEAHLRIELRKGEVVDLLVTPRLFIYRGRGGITLEADGDSIPAVMSLYADVLYLAGLNWWELSGRDADEYGYARIDFHAWAAEHPDEFGAAVRKAVRLLSGRSLAELVQDQKDRKAEDLKKKSRSCWTMTAWRRSLSAVAARLRRRPGGRR